MSRGFITELNDMIDALQAEIERLRAVNAELLAALIALSDTFGPDTYLGVEYDVNSPIGKARAAISRAKESHDVL